MQDLSLTTSQVESALPRVDVGLSKYLWLQSELGARDVGIDAEFQKRFVGFYRVRRGANWRNTYFRILEQAKSSPISFGEALRKLHTVTGRVEASFASKLVATIDPTQPVIDSVVLENTGLKLPYAGSSDRLARIEDVHQSLGSIYAKFLSSGSGRSMVERFKKSYPDASVSEVKMLDLLLWQTRNTS